MLAQYEEKMKKTIESLEKEYSTIRAGRANPHILDRITVLYYGAPTPLQQVAKPHAELGGYQRQKLE